MRMMFPHDKNEFIYIHLSPPRDPYTAQLSGGVVMEFYGFSKSQLSPYSVTKVLLQALFEARDRPADDPLGERAMSFKSSGAQFIIIPRARLTWGILTRAMADILGPEYGHGLTFYHYDWSFGLAVTDGSDDADLAYGEMRSVPQSLQDGRTDGIVSII